MRAQLFVALRSVVPAVVLSVGCASIEAFSANPRTACAGDAVTVTWAAVGDVTIGSEPAVADMGPRRPPDRRSSSSSGTRGSP